MPTTFNRYCKNKESKTVKQLRVPCVPPPHSYLDDTPLPSGDKPKHSTHYTHQIKPPDLCLPALLDYVHVRNFHIIIKLRFSIRMD